MSQWLLDANLLVALASPTHTHHSLAEAWFDLHAREGWATCVVTELAFIRLSLNPALHLPPRNAAAARAMLTKIVTHRSHAYWRDPINAVRTSPFHDVFDRIATYKDVTDAYLVALAERHHGWLATFDEALPKKFDPIARLVTWEM
jgi:toxin-antitoxin system PIN domain toxin